MVSIHINAKEMFEGSRFDHSFGKDSAGNSQLDADHLPIIGQQFHNIVPVETFEYLRLHNCVFSFAALRRDNRHQDDITVATF